MRVRTLLEADDASQTNTVREVRREEVRSAARQVKDRAHPVVEPKRRAQVDRIDLRQERNDVAAVITVEMRAVVIPGDAQNVELLLESINSAELGDRRRVAVAREQVFEPVVTVSGIAVRSRDETIREAHDVGDDARTQDASDAQMTPRSGEEGDFALYPVVDRDELARALMHRRHVEHRNRVRSRYGKDVGSRPYRAVITESRLELAKSFRKHRIVTIGKLRQTSVQRRHESRERIVHLLRTVDEERQLVDLEVRPELEPCSELDRLDVRAELRACRRVVLVELVAERRQPVARVRDVVPVPLQHGSGVEPERDEVLSSHRDVARNRATEERVRRVEREPQREVHLARREPCLLEGVEHVDLRVVKLT